MSKKKNSGNGLLIAEGIGIALSLFVLFLVSKLTDNVTRYELANHLGYGTEVTQTDDTVEVKEEKKASSHLTGDKYVAVNTSTQEKISYRNIVLFGVDSREGQLLVGTRTDTIMIASINEKTKKVKLASVYRDTYLNVGNGQYNKCNAAYAFGGPDRAVTMLNENFDLNITDYVTIGFSGLIDTVNAIGGIEINVTEEEIQYLNSYQVCMAEELGLEYFPVEKAGLQNLNGLQTTAYCRIRYTAGSDFKRTQRQRDVIMSILEKSKTMSILELNSAVNAVLPKVSTSLGMGEILEIISTISQFTIEDNTGVPFADHLSGANTGVGSCVIAYDLVENAKELHKFLYCDEEYTPSETVIAYDRQIKTLTADYLSW